MFFNYEMTCINVRISCDIIIFACLKQSFKKGKGNHPVVWIQWIDVSSLQVQVKFQLKSKSGPKALGLVPLFVAVYFQSANSDAKFYWRYSKHALCFQVASSGLRPRELENKRRFRLTGTTPQGAFTTHYTNWPFAACFKMLHSFSIQYFLFFSLKRSLNCANYASKHFSRFKVQDFDGCFIDFDGYHSRVNMLHFSYNINPEFAKRKAKQKCFPVTLI